MVPPELAGELNEMALRLEEMAEDLSGEDAERLQELADELRRIAQG
jgi:hypothetical protein